MVTKMRKVILVSILTILLLTNTVSAYTEKYCLDNETLRITITKELCDKKGCENITINEDKVCEFGCNPNSNECYQNPLIRLFIASLIIFAILFISYKVIRR